MVSTSPASFVSTPADPLRLIPSCVLPKIELPRTRLRSSPSVRNSIPSSVLPRITLPSPAPVPPIQLSFEPPVISMPSSLFPMAMPPMPWPIQLPRMTLKSALFQRLMPSLLLPAMMFRAAAAAPPMVLLSPPSIRMPAPVLPRSSVPPASTPM